jgi:hypothetical protein
MNIHLFYDTNTKGGQLVLDASTKSIEILTRIIEDMDLDIIINTKNLDIGDINIPKKFDNVISADDLYTKLELYIEIVKNNSDLFNYFGLNVINKNTKSISKNKQPYIIPISEAIYNNRFTNFNSENYVVKDFTNIDILNNTEIQDYMPPLNASYIYNDYTDLYRFTENSDTTSCYIIYNSIYKFSYVLKNVQKTDIDFIVKEFSDYELVKHYDNLSHDHIEQLEKFILCKEFDTKDILIKKIDALDNLFNISSQQVVSKTNMSFVIGYIKENYIIDDNKKNIVKSSSITEDIEKNLKLVIDDLVKFRKDLSKILLELGLKKKRLSDGIYYYGITKKTTPINLTSEDIEMEFQKKQFQYNQLNTNI